MSMINLTKVEVIDNPTNFLNPIQFEIEFEAVADLAEGLFFPPHNQTKKKKTVADPSLSVLAVLMMVLFCLCESWIDLRWKVIYVGSADKEDHDQVLDDINLGPIKEGVSKFLFKVQTPFFLSFFHHPLAPSSSSLVLPACFFGPSKVLKKKKKVEPPNWSQIPDEDLVGVTALMLTVSYKDREFIRVGYFVSNEYPDPEMRENPPPQPKIELLNRNILSDKPRVTRWQIEWD